MGRTPQHSKPWVQVPLDPADGGEKQGQELAGNRDEDVIRSHEGIEGEEAQGRGAVEEDPVRLGGVLEGLGEAGVAVGEGKELHLSASKIQGAHGHMEALQAWEERFPEPLRGEEGLVDAGLGPLILAEEPGGEGHLGIEVHGQDLPALFGQGGGKGDHHRGLLHPAFLVGHGEDRHRFTLSWFMV